MLATRQAFPSSVLHVYPGTAAHTLFPGALRLKHTSAPVKAQQVAPKSAAATHTTSTPSLLNNPQIRGRAINLGTNVSAAHAQAGKHGYTHQRAKWAGASGAAVLGTLYFLSGDDGGDDAMLGRPNPADVDALSRLPLSKLISGWITYAFCSSPILIEMSEPLFRTLRQIPIVSYLVDDFARRTFFRQFFGEETSDEATKTVWAPLRKDHIGVLTAYNVEAETFDSKNSPDTIRECVSGTIAAIEAVGEFGKANSSVADFLEGDTRCWVCTKLSGLVPDPKTMIRASEQLVSMRTGTIYYPGVPEDGDFQRLMNAEGLSTSDRKSIHNLYDYLRQFMVAAQKHSVRIIMDAEQSWYQPVVDVMTEELMREFNNGKTGPPVVSASFQAYLRRNSEMIQSQLERAKEGGYKLIFKQVRGAYMPYERERWASQSHTGPCPVWDTKAETDANFDRGMRASFEALKAYETDPAAANVAVSFATHNEVSVDNAINYLDSMGLGSRQADGSLLLSDFAANRVAFAQIYGMKDNLTNRTVASIKTPSGLPVVSKYAVYGTLEHALPNLSRRAAENKTIMEGRGGAVAERKRIGREFYRRYLPFYHSDR